MTVVAIDPGYRESAWVTFDGRRIVAHGIQPNADLLARFSAPFGIRTFGLLHEPMTLVLEQIESFGMAVGREIFETVFWTGRLYEAGFRVATRTERMTRRAVKLHLCHSSQAKDANVRQVLIDRFGGSSAKGTKKSPGPLYGISSHEWAALAIAVTWWDTRRNVQADLPEERGIDVQA